MFLEGKIVSDWARVGGSAHCYKDVNSVISDVIIPSVCSSIDTFNGQI